MSKKHKPNPYPKVDCSNDAEMVREGLRVRPLGDKLNPHSHFTRVERKVAKRRKERVSHKQAIKLAGLRESKVGSMSLDLFKLIMR